MPWAADPLAFELPKNACVRCARTLLAGQLLPPPPQFQNTHGGNIISHGARLNGTDFFKKIVQPGVEKFRSFFDAMPSLFWSPAGRSAGGLAHWRRLTEARASIASGLRDAAGSDASDSSASSA